MAYNGKTNWTNNEIVEAVDMNRIEQGITNNDAGLGSVQAEVTAHKADGTQHKKTARFVVGTSTAGWTAADCDYLCDGTEDQTEINAAITALPATGGEVVILDGTYNITAKIDVTKDNVSIRGNGNATILKRMYNNLDLEGIINLNEVSGCTVEKLYIDGNKANYTASEPNNFGIFLSSSSNNNITSNTCNNSDFLGIVLFSSNENTITGNTCNNNDYGIHLENSSNNAVTGNPCNNNDYGIYLSSSNNNTVTGNPCPNNDYGIYLTSSNNSTVTGNTCNNNDYGIFLNSSSNNTVTGNTCIRGTGLSTDYTVNQHTIQLKGTMNKYNLISNNNCMGKAVTNEGGTGNTIIDNKWSNSPGRILENYSEKLVTLSGTSAAINLSLGNVFTHSLTGNTTYSISNAVSGEAHSFTLIITQTATVRTLTFPSSIKWQGGEIPDLSTASKTYVLTFMTVNGGTTWLGMFGGEF